MPARDGHVVEEDLALGVPAGGHHVGVEQEPAARARPALHDQQGAARRQGVHRGRVGVVEGALLRCSASLTGPPKVIVAVVSLGRLARAAGGRLETAPALRAEARAVGVLVSALRAERHGRPPGAVDQSLLAQTLNRQSRFTVRGANLSVNAGPIKPRQARAQDSRLDLVRRGVHQGVDRSGVRRHDLEEPALAVRVGVDQLGGGVERLVAGD